MPYMLNITAVLFKCYAWKNFPCYFIFKHASRDNREKTVDSFGAKSPEKSLFYPSPGKPTIQIYHIMNMTLLFMCRRWGVMFLTMHIMYYMMTPVIVKVCKQRRKGVTKNLYITLPREIREMLEKAGVNYMLLEARENGEILLKPLPDELLRSLTIQKK